MGLRNMKNVNRNCKRIHFTLDFVWPSSLNRQERQIHARSAFAWWYCTVLMTKTTFIPADRNCSSNLTISCQPFPLLPMWCYLKVDQATLAWPEAGRLPDQSSHQMVVEGEGTNEELKGELTLPQSLLLANLQSLIIARVKLLPLPYNSSHLPM